MRIGILGSGNIGSALGRSWARAGHEVLFASRHPDRLAELAARAGSTARVGTLDEALAFGDVLLDALPFAASLQLPPAAVAGKLVVSASNYYPQRDGDLDLQGASQTEAVAAALPGAVVVKAFNAMYAAQMELRADGREVDPLTIFVAGDDPVAKGAAADLVRAAAFEPLDVGPLATGRLFQTDGPLYGAMLAPAEAADAVEAARG
ncbi:NAD(P)-binding domain-containing protein [Angustibacter peucedani]